MILSPGQEVAGRYEIIKKIGSGGMANVYKALDTKLNRYVTFKVMREEYVTDDDFLRRFDIEARAAASLSNQHIVNVYDVGSEYDIHYIVMEYVDGVTLKQLVKKRAPFNNDEILGVAIQIAQALEHAHKNNIVHRDIKPQNILVTRGGISKVTDFGIARAATATTITTSSNSMGSVHYFSPEQARGGFVDFKSDIYSLGIVMFEMATGQLPFEGDSPVSIALKHINDPLPDLTSINPNLSDKIISIMCKATAKLSADRYQDINEMGNDLKRALTNSSDEGRAFGESTLTLTDEEIEQINNEAQAMQSPTKVPRSKRTSRSEIMAMLPEADDQPEEWYLGPGKIRGNVRRPIPMEDFVDDDDDGMFSDKKVVIAAVLTSFVLILLIFSLFYWVFLRPGTPEPALRPLNVPNFANGAWSLEDANNMARDMGFEIKVEGEEASDFINAGNIISQNYGSENALYEGGTLWVTLSTGSGKYEVPDLSRRTADEAYEILSELDYPFEPSQVLEFSNDMPIGSVIRHEPPAGSMVPAGTLITLYISSGPAQKTAVVPNLNDKTEAEAISLLQEAGLAAPRAVRAASATVPEGKVIRQAISAGTEIPVGSPVEFTVSSGPPPEVTATPSPSPSPSSNGNGSEGQPSESKVTKTLPIHLASIPEGAETVHVRVLLGTDSGNETVFDGRINVSDLPLQLPVSGTGQRNLMVFTVEDDGRVRTQGETNIDFSQ